MLSESPMALVDHAFDARKEMIAMKVIELFAEAIPGGILQTYVLLVQPSHNAEVQVRSFLSLASSFMTSGFTAALISYDFDTDPDMRKESRDFFGFIPDHATMRTVIFVCMVITSAIQLCVRCFTTALLAITLPAWFVCYVIIDLVFYFVIKILRNDFFHWVFFRGEGRLNYIGSFSIRLITKVTNDNISIVHFRHPHLLGGVTWTTSVFMRKDDWCCFCRCLEIDYGQRFSSKVRARVTTFIEVEALGPQQSEFRIWQILDPQGYVPTFVLCRVIGLAPGTSTEVSEGQ